MSKSTIAAAIGRHRSEAGAGSPIQPWPWCWSELTPANTLGFSRMQLLLQPQPQSALQVCEYRPHQRATKRWLVTVSTVNTKSISVASPQLCSSGIQPLPALDKGKVVLNWHLPSSPFILIPHYPLCLPVFSQFPTKIPGYKTEFLNCLL